MASEHPSKSSELFEMPSLSIAPSLSSQRFYSYKEPEPSPLSFRSLSPSYSSPSLPFSLFKFISVVRTHSRNFEFSLKLLMVCVVSIILFLQRSHHVTLQSEPPPAEVICAMSEWKDTPTVSGLIVRAAEQNPYIGTLEKFRILYLLAFASTPFLIKLACVISERDTNMNPTGWLLKFIDVVEDALSSGLPEETYLDARDQQALKDSYERIMKMSSGLRMKIIVRYCL